MTHHYQHSYSGNNYDRWVASQSNTSALGKVQKQFWFTKSAVLRKFGKNEDKYIAASDAELDAKIELFKAIESCTQELQLLLADYQTKLCLLAQEENSLGRFLKEEGKQDQTRAGKMMNAVGKSLSYTAQQRVALRSPLVRLFQEVDTFQTRAVKDTARTVQEVEKVRTEYRGALMWMKNISKDFNPDHYEQLEKFREVQNVVKQKKSRFDQIKIKVLQKIELLAASRCNMFSHALILYQNTLITFSEKTAKTLSSVAANFKGYEPYKFQVIKELADLPLPDEDGESPNDSNIANFLDYDCTDHSMKKEDSKTELSNLTIDQMKGKQGPAKHSKDDDSLLSFNENKVDLQHQNINNNKIRTKDEFIDVDLLLEDHDALKTDSQNLEEFGEFLDSLKLFEPSVTNDLPAFGNGTAINVSSTSNPLEKNENVGIKESHNSITSINSPFLPSQLLDFGLLEFDTPINQEFVNSNDKNLSTNSLNERNLLVNNEKSEFFSSTPSASANENSSSANLTLNKTSDKKAANKLDWFKIFQDIDPLSDPASALFTQGIESKKC